MSNRAYAPRVLNLATFYYAALQARRMYKLLAQGFVGLGRADEPLEAQTVHLRQARQAANFDLGYTARIAYAKQVRS